MRYRLAHKSAGIILVSVFSCQMDFARDVLRVLRGWVDYCPALLLALHPFRTRRGRVHGHTEGVPGGAPLIVLSSLVNWVWRQAGHGSSTFQSRLQNKVLIVGILSSLTLCLLTACQAHTVHAAIHSSFVELAYWPVNLSLTPCGSLA